MKRVIGLVLLGASLVASACNGDEAGLEIPIEAGPEASSDALSGFDASLLVDTGVEAGSDADSGPDSDSAAVDADAGGCPAFGDSGVTYGAACDDCGGERCCEPLSVCLGDPDCAGMASCWLACLASDGGTPCQDDCKKAHPDSIVPHFDAMECLKGSCATECDL